ncbi:MAG: phenylalanine--tRNA ligase subunit alpha [Coxiella sp. (in: Bacteria)]|nr:MAG: phenylalanine--tRNA ligase subunit alpha [Coxiella sp. (in: g-proteobacteria)]
MSNEIDVLLTASKGAVKQSEDLKALEQVRLEYLGKQGKFTDLMKGLGKLSKEERPAYGKAINEAKNSLVEILKAKQAQFAQIVLDEKLASEVIDITLPGRERSEGSLHPVTLVKRRVAEIFSQLGFSIEEGPEIEDDYHNFQALNIPEHHPARQSQDTFFCGEGLVLRTHTSPVQIRTMKRDGAPVRVVAMGRVFRRDSDHTHTPMFHQLEGLVVEKGCTFADLKGMLHQFVAAFFGEEIRLRFRPSYFPFTEPSAEVDIEHNLCNGKGCRVCSYSGWLEVLGCGMVHPNVLQGVDIDPDEYNGFAFGVGLDRLAMLLYGVDDLRLFFENDERFLAQFV